MFKIGITGTIGSGKSTVCTVFETLGVPVYNADVQAKRILEYPHVLMKLEKEFGQEIFNDKQVVNKQKLAHIVFNDNEKLAVLNGIIHPLVKQDFECWLTLQHAKPYILHEAAILLESGFGSYFNRIIMITAPEELRMKRVMERDHVTKEQFKQRTLHQWTEAEKLKHADFVIYNDETHLLIPQVLELHRQIIELL